MQVWDRDMWIRTDTSVAVYDDRFRAGEQLYGTCVRAPPSRLQERRDLQERSIQRSTEAAAQHVRHTAHRRLRRFWAEQDELLSPEAAVGAADEEKGVPVDDGAGAGAAAAGAGVPRSSRAAE